MRFPRRRRSGSAALVIVALAALGLGLVVSPVSAAPGPTLNFGSELSADQCGGGQPLIDANIEDLNVADTAVSGAVWALDASKQSIRIWETAPGSFCVILSSEGSFASFAGPSINGTGTVSAGVTGPLEGGFRFRGTGVFAPTVPTHGFVGTFDWRCDQAGNCPTPAGFSTLYFSSFHLTSFDWYGFIYHGGTHGTAVQSIDGNSGDITG
jgi:hypothetical protein